MSSRKIWWQIYRPVILTKNQKESFYKQFTPEEFAKIMHPESGLAFPDNFPITRHIIMAEYFWIYTDKPNFFVEKGIVDFVLNTASEHSVDVLKLDHPIAISWHPDENLPCCLVYPTKPAVFIHVNGPKGTWILQLPRDGENVDDDLSPDMLRLKQAVFGLLTYMRAFPNLVRSGMPVTMKERNARLFTGKGQCITLHDKIRATPSTHFRSGHWRCLTQEQFSRNPDGSVRIVYVNPAIVGQITPYTVEID